MTEPDLAPEIRPFLTHGEMKARVGKATERLKFCVADGLLWQQVENGWEAFPPEDEPPSENADPPAN